MRATPRGLNHPNGSPVVEPNTMDAFDKMLIKERRLPTPTGSTKIQLDLVPRNLEALQSFLSPPQQASSNALAPATAYTSHDILDALADDTARKELKPHIIAILLRQSGFEATSLTPREEDELFEAFLRELRVKPTANQIPSISPVNDGRQTITAEIQWAAERDAAPGGEVPRPYNALGESLAQAKLPARAAQPLPKRLQNNGISDGASSASSNSKSVRPQPLRHKAPSADSMSTTSDVGTMPSSTKDIRPSKSSAFSECRSSKD